MSEYRKTPEAIAALTPEQYRVTQQSGTDAPARVRFSTTKSPVSMSTSSLASHYSRPRTSSNLGAVGRASPSPSSMPTLRN